MTVTIKVTSKNPNSATNATFRPGSFLSILAVSTGYACGLPKTPGLAKDAFSRRIAIFRGSLKNKKQFFPFRWLLAGLALWLLPLQAWAGLFEDAVSGDVDVAASEEDAETTSTSGLSASVAGFNFELNGHLRGDLYVGKMPGKADAEIKSGYGEAGLKLRVNKAPYGSGFAEMRFRYGHENGEQAMHLDLREAYVNLYLWRFDFRIGHQIIVWGRADGINPTNNLTPTTMALRSPDEDDRRLANFGLRMFLNVSPVRLEGVWLPFYAASELPQLPFPENIQLREDFPDLSIKNGLGAGRVHLELPEVEMSFSYLYGYAPQPGLAFSMEEKDVSLMDDALLVLIDRKPYRQHVAGFDFSAPVRDWFGLRGEAAYRRPVDFEDKPYAANPDIRWVLGLDREFAGQVSVIVQYVGVYVFDWERKEATGDLSGSGAPLPELNDQTRPAIYSMLQKQVTEQLAQKNQQIYGQTERWQHSAFTRIEWSLMHETLSLEVSGMVNFSTWEWLARPKISYDITDALQILFGGEIYGGPDDTLFGMIDQIQSAGYVEAKVSF